MILYRGYLYSLLLLVYISICLISFSIVAMEEVDKSSKLTIENIKKVTAVADLLQMIDVKHAPSINEAIADRTIELIYDGDNTKVIVKGIAEGATAKKINTVSSDDPMVVIGEFLKTIKKGDQEKNEDASKSKNYEGGIRPIYDKHVQQNSLYFFDEAKAKSVIDIFNDMLYKKQVKCIQELYPAGKRIKRLKGTIILTACVGVGCWAGYLAYLHGVGDQVTLRNALGTVYHGLLNKKVLYGIGAASVYSGYKFWKINSCCTKQFNQSLHKAQKIGLQRWNSIKKSSADKNKYTFENVAIKYFDKQLINNKLELYRLLQNSKESGRESFPISQPSRWEKIKDALCAIFWIPSNIFTNISSS